MNEVLMTPERQSLSRGRLAAYVRLFDPAPVSVVLVASTAYAFVAGHGAPPLGRLVLFLLALLLTQFAIAFHNHYCDRQLDAAVRPWRALPRGLVSPRQVLLMAWAMFALGLALALTLGANVAALVALGTGAGFLYNAYLKRTPWSWLPYWLALPTLVVCVFFVVGRPEARLWLTYLVGLPLVLAVHLGDALSDAELDDAQGVNGLAQWLGRPTGLFVCGLALALALVLALAFRPALGAARVPYLVAIAALALAGLASLMAWRRVHWFAVMGCAVALGLGWVADLAT